MKNEIIKKTCAVTGHRRLDKNFKIERVKEVLKEIIDNGYEYFLVGMAVGFDTVCFKVLSELKENGENIKIIACIPCPEQDKYFPEPQKREYRKMLDSADGKIVLSDSYTPYCMQKRNRYMVDNCAILFAYLCEEKGGTKNTVLYAEKTGKPVIYY